jgi:hypothetical protein
MAPGELSFSFQSKDGADAELTTKMMILRTWSSGVGWPANRNASNASRKSNTPRSPGYSKPLHPPDGNIGPRLHRPVARVPPAV